jgi:hypothetical protein
VFALLSLDHYHGCRFERGKDGTVAIPRAEEAQTSKSNSAAKQSACLTFEDGTSVRDRYSSIKSPQYSSSSTCDSKPQSGLPDKPPHTYHPLYSTRLSPSEGFYLQTAYDAIMISLLVIHVVNFFTSFPSNLRTCKHSSREPLPDADPLHAKLTIAQRCKRINIDIHVSGGFDIAFSLVLLGLHVWHFAYRIFEGREMCASSARGCEDEEEGRSGMHTIGRSLPNSQFMSHTRTQGSRMFNSSADEEGRMGMDLGARRSDRSKEKRKSETASRTSGCGSESESSKWSEALLECLVP